MESSNCFYISTPSLMFGKERINMSIFSRTKKSERVNGLCCICNSKIDYLYKPSNQVEHLELFRYSDIDLVNICGKCGSLRHALCSSERKEEIRSKISDITKGPTFGEALKGTVEGGCQEHNIFLDVLEKETRGLECPICGSFKTLPAFIKRDGSIIKIKSGKRID